jgi:ssDNA-binding Zn-finger/Zn-ribbon topoisomerase 1
VSTTIQRRVDALEVSSCIHDGGWCPKCNETLIVIRDATTGAFHSARDGSGEELSAEELCEREARCPRCGRERATGLVIKVGGAKGQW